MTIEKLKAVYEATNKETWTHDREMSAVVYVHNHRVNIAADFGKIDASDANAEFIALAHNMMPDLLAAAQLLQVAYSYDPGLFENWPETEALLARLSGKEPI